jgi:hypothetical protein
MQFSLSQAAKETGKGKSSIHRAIKSGKLSAQRHEDGTYSIDAAELFRAFPPAPPQPVPERGMEPHQEPPATPTVTEEVLRVRVEMLTAQLEREQDTVADLRRRLDRAEERILVLSHSPVTAPVAPAAASIQPTSPKPHRRGLWSFLRRS